MSLTNPTVLLNTTFSAKNIASAASVYDYTVTANGKINIAVKLTNAAGNGDYIVYLKRQWLGTGTASVILPKTTATAASGETVVEFQTMMVSVIATDVISVFIDGLAGDTSVNGNIQILQDNYSLLETADNIGINWADVANPTSTVALTNTTINTSSLSASVAITATDADQVADGEYSLRTHYTFAQTVTSTSTADLSTALIWFAIKADPDDADSASILMFDTATGLLYVNGAAPVAPVVAGDAAISVTGSSGAWSIALRVEARAMAVLDGIDEGPYAAALKYSLGSDDKPIQDGWATINAGRIKAVS